MNVLEVEIGDKHHSGSRQSSERSSGKGVPWKTTMQVDAKVSSIPLSLKTQS